ncbi:MAG TPA: hypothetical protein VFV38_24125 [Ktedonobacteraceae bacterium]|nr:hypothetical protein [Ktedonobacteraceae bacterium]
MIRKALLLVETAVITCIVDMLEGHDPFSDVTQLSITYRGSSLTRDLDETTGIRPGDWAPDTPCICVTDGKVVPTLRAVPRDTLHPAHLWRSARSSVSRPGTRTEEISHGIRASIIFLKRRWRVHPMPSRLVLKVEGMRPPDKQEELLHFVRTQLDLIASGIVEVDRSTAGIVNNVKIDAEFS